jgi:hypothetical protein
MKSTVVEDADVITYVAICDPGAEAVRVPSQFAPSEDLEGAQITVAGAFDRVFPTLEAVVNDSQPGPGKSCGPISGPRSSIWTRSEP